MVLIYRVGWQTTERVGWFVFVFSFPHTCHGHFVADSIWHTNVVVHGKEWWYGGGGGVESGIPVIYSVREKNTTNP